MYNRIYIFIIQLLLLTILLSCNSNTKVEKEIESRINHIENLINNNNLNAAKIELDSIHILYPRMVDARRTAKSLEDTIIRIENIRTLAYCDSILPIKQHQADSIQKNFIFVKDEAYQTTGNYVYKSLRLEANMNRTYLRAYVTENSDFYLISNFTGNYNIDHTCVSVSVGDIYATTDTIPLSSPMNHSFSDDGTFWEIVTFTNEAAENVPVFITQYSNERIKITLKGKRNYTYYLTDADKKALSETYNLWVAKKDVEILKKEIEKATFNIERINQRYQEN